MLLTRLSVLLLQLSSWVHIMYMVMDNAGIASFLFFVAIVLLESYYVVGWGKGGRKRPGARSRRTAPLHARVTQLLACCA